MFRDPVGHRIKTLNNLMKRNMERHIGALVNDSASMMHTWIIGFLEMRESEGVDTFQKDIEVEFSINRSTTSEMLKLMSAKGMIKRVPVAHDARLKKIILTKQSHEFNSRMDELMKQLYDELTEGLSHQDIEQYLKISDKLIENLRKK